MEVSTQEPGTRWLGRLAPNTELWVQYKTLPQYKEQKKTLETTLDPKTEMYVHTHTFIHVPPYTGLCTYAYADHFHMEKKVFIRIRQITRMK